MTSGRLRKSSVQDRRKHRSGRKYTHEPQEVDSKLHIIVRGRQNKQNRISFINTKNKLVAAR